MNRSQSCAALLAASLAVTACPTPVRVLSAPTSAQTPPPSAQLGTTSAQNAPTSAQSAPAARGAASTQSSAVLAGAALAATTQPAATQPAATQPAGAQGAAAAPDGPPAQIRFDFHDTPLDTILEHLSQDAGFQVVKEAPVDARVTVMSLQPLTPKQAVSLLNEVLKGNGLAAVQEGNTLRIVPRDKARKGNLPVHYGADPAAVAATGELITQVIPVHNVDAVKLRQDLTPLIGTDADVTANAGANAIVMTDTSANVRRIVEIVSILDKREGTTSQVKIIPLKNASAPAAARLVLSIFHVEEPRPKPGQPAPAQPVNQGRLLGTGVDQALYGGKVTAAADERTNSVIVAAPAKALEAIESMIKEIDENPATAAMPGIKSFHLKVADAAAVARALRAVFRLDEQPQAAQSHQQASEQPLSARVTVVPEERTNTIIVTAPPAAMKVVEGLINDVDGHPATSSIVRSFQLKYADAAATAKILLQVFIDPNTGQSRLQAGARDKVSATADTRTNTVFVTAPLEAMPLVEKTIKDMDASPTSDGNVKFFHLRQADSDATAKLILNFFKPPEGMPNQKRPPDAVHFGINAVSDPRTNTVAVTAPAEAMATIERIIQEVETAPTTSFEIESFTLKNADATAAAKLLTTVFQPDPQSAAIGPKSSARDLTVKEKVVAAADDRTNTVVVTAPADTLKVIEGVVKLLDANPQSGAQIQVYELKNADASRAAALIQSIFEPAVLQPNNNPTGVKPPGAVDALRKLGWVSTSSDERTNTLIVTATPEVLHVVNGIVQHLDSNPTSQETLFIYKLRNAQAQNLEIVLNQLFGNLQLGATSAGARGSAGSQQFGQLVGSSAGRSTIGIGAAPGLGSGSSGLNGLGPTAAGGAGGTGIGARIGGTSASAANNRLPQLSAGMSQIVTQLTGQVYVVADLDTNSLLVTTATRYKKEVRDIIAELDRPVPQVLIKVLVAEVTHENTADFGMDFSILNRRPSGNGTIVGQTLGNTAAYAANGGLAVSLMETNLNATLHALATEGKLDVLSRPYILASDNQLASITVGQEVPFISDTRVDSLGGQFNTVTYQDVGIILNVTPHINPEGLVIMDVAPEISQLTGSTVAIGAGVDAPVIDKRSALSRVGIQNNQTIVIGGLMEDRKTDTINKIPLLGDIPLIGELFKRTQTDKTKTELLIFLTPHVAQQPDSLRDMAADEMRGTKLTRGAVSPGMFDEHMRGMQRGGVTEPAPATQPAGPVIEFAPATQPANSSGPESSGPIKLP